VWYAFSMIRIAHHPHGPRVYIAGRRVHHGLAGGIAAVALLGTSHRNLALGAAAWAMTDWRDFPFRDCDNH
jgi:hypothetical protein